MQSVSGDGSSEEDWESDQGESSQVGYWSQEQETDGPEYDVSDESERTIGWAQYSTSNHRTRTAASLMPTTDSMRSQSITRSYRGGSPQATHCSDDGYTDDQSDTTLTSGNSLCGQRHQQSGGVPGRTHLERTHSLNTSYSAWRKPIGIARE